MYVGALSVVVKCANRDNREPVGEGEDMYVASKTLATNREMAYLIWGKL